MQLDAMTEINAETSAEEPAAATPRHKERTAINASGVTFGDGAESYVVFNLPPVVRDQIAVIGLRYILVNAKDRAAMFAKMIGGEVPGQRAKKEKAPTKPRELSLWRPAWAHWTADVETKAAGHKVAVGKNPTPEFKMALDDAMQRAAQLDAKALTVAKSRWQVVQQWERLTAAACGE